MLRSVAELLRDTGSVQDVCSLGVSLFLRVSLDV